MVPSTEVSRSGLMSNYHKISSSLLGPGEGKKFNLEGIINFQFVRTEGLLLHEIIEGSHHQKSTLSILGLFSNPEKSGNFFGPQTPPVISS